MISLAVSALSLLERWLDFLDAFISDCTQGCGKKNQSVKVTVGITYTLVITDPDPNLHQGLERSVFGTGEKG
jgi:hypothetical protein